MADSDDVSRPSSTFITTGVTSLEDFADDILGGFITALEDDLGITTLDDALGLDSCDGKTSGKSDVYLVGEGLCYIEKGLGITSIDDFLNEESGGAIDALESTLGITSLEEALGLTSC